MANEHPFQSLFETLGRPPAAHAEAVNRRAYEILNDILSVPVDRPGRCVLLRAPRAGHGKTHLLSRIQHHLGASHEFIPLHASFGCQIDASSVIDDALRRLLRSLPASGGLTVLDLVTRRLFAGALQPLVGSGEVPCQDREGALTALRSRPVETFDFHHPNAVTAHWARENFEVLGQRLSVEIASRCNLPAREVTFWVDTLFRFAATPLDDPARMASLSDAIHGGDPAEGVQMDRLVALLGMLAQLVRVVVVGDDLEGFSADESAALRLAAFIGSLRQSVERLDVILSLNQDIWESAFVPRLSGGLADRLSEVVIELEPLTEKEMVALLESRVPGLGSRVLERVDRGEAGSHARGLIRAAGVAWLRASAGGASTPAPQVPSSAAPVLPVMEEVVSKEVPAEAAKLSTAETSADTPPVLEDPAPESVVEAAEPSEQAEAEQAAEFSELPEPAAEPAAPEDSPVVHESLDLPQSETVDEAAEGGWQAPAAEVDEPLSESGIPAISPAEVVSEIPQTAAEVPPAALTPAEPLEPAESSGLDDPPESAAADSPPQATPDTDRVDDLLKQFRERYGRGGM